MDIILFSKNFLSKIQNFKISNCILSDICRYIEIVYNYVLLNVQYFRIIVQFSDYFMNFLQHRF